MTLDITTLTDRKVLKVKANADGLETIADLRRQAKAENLKQRAKALLDPSYKPTFVRVVTFGRLGKNSPHAWVYKNRNRGFRNGYQRINIQHAAEIAVYINPMHEYTYGCLGVTYKFNFVK